MKTTLSTYAVISILLRITVSSTPTETVKQSQPVVEDYRLPTQLTPINYDITISPYFEGEKQFTFDGVVRITIRTSQSNISEIVVHAHNLTFREAMNTLTEAKDPTSIVITNRTINNVTQKYTLTLGSPLKVNTDYALVFYYTGFMGTEMKGFYRSSYIQDGVKIWIGATHLQPTYARQVFPCFDEPNFKSTFDLKIIRPKNFTVSVSNTKLKSSLEMGAQDVYEEFRTTPRMPTYLLSFIVSDLRIRENAAKSFSVIARSDAYTQTEYAHNIGPRILARLEDYLDYRYSSVMEKMDMAALPDLMPDAMENWGLLTFKESNLLYDPIVSSYMDQQRIGQNIGLSQSNMWFGNLVTCDWWKFTWLNEGFAQYFKYFGTSLLPETHWDLNLQFSVENLQKAFLVDSLAWTHPMTYDVASPDEILSMFDEITYEKAASILRMTEHIIGSDNFQSAVQQFVKDNLFGSSTPEKLYSAFQRYSGDTININTFLSTWTTQSGYPVVTVERKEDAKNLVISQRRFLMDGQSHNDTSKWELHLNYALSTSKNFDNTRGSFVMSRDQNSIELELQEEVDWAIFNIQQTGFYRVNYDTVSWQNIGKTLHENLSHIHVLNRAQIVDDSLNLARANYIDYNLALHVLEYLENEVSYLPWLAAFNNLEYISSRFSSNQVATYKNFILKLIDNTYNRLGFTAKSTDSRLDVYLRTMITGYACKFGHNQCRSAAKLEFEHMETSSTYRIPVNIRPTVYCTGVAEGSTDEWNYLWYRYLRENVATEQIVILQALGCTRDRDLLEKYLEFIVTGSSIRLQDKLLAFNSIISGHEQNVQVALDYVISNYQKIVEYFHGHFKLSEMLSSIAKRLSTQQQITQLENFYTTKRTEFERQSDLTRVNNAIISAKFNMQWASEQLPAIVEYMRGVTGSAKMICTSFTLIVLGVLSALF